MEKESVGSSLDKKRKRSLVMGKNSCIYVGSREEVIWKLVPRQELSARDGWWMLFFTHEGELYCKVGVDTDH